MYFVNVTIDPSLTASVQNFSNPSWDTFLVLFFITASIIYAFFVSRERLAVVLLSIYSSLAIVSATPIVGTLLKGYEDTKHFEAKLGVFVAFFLLLYVLLSRNMTLHAEIGHRWWQAVLLSVLQVGLFISTILSFIPADIFSSELSKGFFTSDTARSAWLLFPIGAMLFMKNKQHGGPAPRQF